MVKHRRLTIVLLTLGCASNPPRRATTPTPEPSTTTTVGDFRTALLQRCGTDATWCALWLCPEGSVGREHIGAPDALDGCVFGEARQLDAHSAGSVVRALIRPLYESENGFVDVLTSKAPGVYGPPRIAISGALNQPISTLREVAQPPVDPTGDALVQRYLIAYRQLPETGFLGALAGLLANPPQQLPGFHMPTREEFDAAFNDALPPNHRYGRIEGCAAGSHATLVLEVSATGDVSRALATHPDAAAEACLMQTVAGAHFSFGPSWFAIAL